MKLSAAKWLVCVIPVLWGAGCTLDSGVDPAEQSAQAMEGYGEECVLDTPTVTVVGSTQSTIEIEVCAGPSGAPAGFAVQWLTKDAFVEAGYEWPDSACKAWLKEVGADECLTVKLGELGEESGVCSSCQPLECGTEFVIRAKAKSDGQCEGSEHSCKVKGETKDCDKGCTLTQGFWKNHPEAWPVSSLTLGSVTYSQDELLAILRQPVGGNGLVQLAHQLIAAKLNIASGADDADIADAIEDADALIDGLVVPPVGSGTLPTKTTSALNDELTGFNEGESGPGHCENNEQESK
jgi:hypothetical protein